MCQSVIVEVRGPLVGSFLSFHHVDLRNQTHVTILGDKGLYLLSHLISLTHEILKWLWLLEVID